MKKMIVIVMTVLSINCFAQTKNFIDQNYIEVTGKAEMEIVPNEIYLKIILNEKNFKGKETVDEMEKTMIEKLQGIGIDVSKNLAIEDMTSNFKDYWIVSSRIHSVKIYQLKVYDAQTAGSVFRELESIDISNITIKKVDHSELQDFKQKVKVMAIKAARQKAESLAAAIRQGCGRAIYIEELNNQSYKFDALQGRLAGKSSNIVIREISATGNTSAPEIEFEKIKLEYSILARFELY